MIETYKVLIETTGDDPPKIEYDLLRVPKDFLLGLSNAAKLEFARRLSAECAPDFRRERALQHERYMEHLQNSQDNPKQIFIDFPIS